MRPGLSAHVELLDGSNAGTDERVNFHLVSAHLKSGGNRYSHGLRQQSLEGIVTTFHERQSIWEDEDMIVAGDLNTLGCWGCDPRLDSAEEVTELRATVEAAEVPFYALTPDVECTFQTGLRGRTLDHFLVSDGPLDLRNNAEVSVQGYCAQDGCTSSVAQSRARKELSDHCPVVLDVR